MWRQYWWCFGFLAGMGVTMVTVIVNKAREPIREPEDHLGLWTYEK